MPFFKDFELAADQNCFLAQFPNMMTLTAAIDDDLNPQDDPPDVMGSKVFHLMKLIAHFSANAALKNLLIYYYADYIFWMNKRQQNPELAYTDSALSILQHAQLPEEVALSEAQQDDQDSIIALRIALMVQRGLYAEALNALANAPYHKSEMRFISLKMTPFKCILQSAVLAATFQKLEPNSEPDIDACYYFFVDKFDADESFQERGDKVDVIIDLLFDLLQTLKLDSNYTLQTLNKVLMIFEFAVNCTNYLQENFDLSPEQLHLIQIISIASFSAHSLKVVENAQVIERQVEAQINILSASLADGSEKEKIASGLITAMVFLGINFKAAQAENIQASAY